MACLDVSIIRALWSIVEKQPHLIVGLSDAAAATWLVGQIKERTSLTPDEAQLINSYVLSRRILIRTVAESCYLPEAG